MKKLLIAASIVVSAMQLTNAQTQQLFGTVSDIKGNTLHHVFIEDKQYKLATFTDSLGNFSINLQPDSKLLLNAAGYADTLISARSAGTSIQIVLTHSGDATVSPSAISAQAQIQSTSTGQVATLSEGGSIAPGHQKQDTKGSRYLFTTFVRGYIITASDDLIYSSALQFDYDKINGDLLLSRDGHSIEAVNWDQIKGFTLFSPTDQRFDFESAPSVDKSHYVQVLATGKKYKIYKLIKTKFIQSDYVNTGIVQHGKDYDEYVDDADYYVFDVQSNQPTKISLRKKSLKEAFTKDFEKVNRFLSSNSASIDDDYLAKLGNAMNQ